MHEIFPIAAATNDIGIQCRCCIGVMLAVAAADADHCMGIVFPAAADHCAVLPVRYGGDGAGIDNIAVAGL